MPLPLAINLRIVRHYVGKIWNNHWRDIPGDQAVLRIPLVLMLELTHACNLKCQGCGRIREYVDTRDERLTRAQARSAMLEADTPFVSISGGEPLLHPEASGIASDALALGKVVYFCTNGLLLAKRLGEFEPHPLFFFNVHMDGPPEIHDALVGLPGAAEKALEGMRLAREAGFNLTTNTTIYRGTPVDEIAHLFELLTRMGVRGLMVAPGFTYEAGLEVGTLSHDESLEWFQSLYEVWKDRNLIHTPLYMQFLRGERALKCMPWGTVTYNPRGWKTPCYLLTGSHVGSFRELMENTDWEKYGPGRDPRCADCLMHSGFEPSVVSSIRGMKDGWNSIRKLVRWQLER